MFHHFHDDNIHKKSPGSYSKDDFYKAIKFIGRENILGANDFHTRLKENKLKDKNICLTFDDGIKSQYDVALPVLEDLKIKSFFFIPTSIFTLDPDLLEIYRYFRVNYFNDIDLFYNDFYKLLDKDLSTFFNENKKIIQIRKDKKNFYSINDIKFRLVRDKFLSKIDYKKIMFLMFKEKKFKPEDHFNNVYMNKLDVKKINECGHLIGLHTHSHPFLLENLSGGEQKKEYEKNISTLSEILNKEENKINSMSHPAGSYSPDTLKILQGLKIEIGFKNVMNIEIDKSMKKINNSPLEIARQDSGALLRILKKD